MSSEKSKTVEEQLVSRILFDRQFGSWTIPEESVSRNRRVSIRSWHPIKASYYLYIAFRLAKNRVSFRRNLNAASVHVFDRRSSCCLDENDFSRQIFENLSAIQSDERFSFRFVSSRNNNNLEGKADRSTVLTFSLFLLLRFIATSR